MSEAGARCSDRSQAAGERLAGTATAADEWLLVEAPGSWARDVGAGEGLPAPLREAVVRWLEGRSGRRLLLVRRPGRTPAKALAFVVAAREAEREVRRLELDTGPDGSASDFEADGEPVDARLALVCGHGSRDACCALRGTAVYGALAGVLGEEELWITSHQGGHRFAANVLVLPAGIHLGRVEPGEAADVVGRALQGRIALERYRGRTVYPPPVQAAEHALRAALALDGVDELELAAVDGDVVRFRLRDGAEHAVRVVEEPGPAVPASCGAAPEPQAAYRASPLARVSA